MHLLLPLSQHRRVVDARHMAAMVGARKPVHMSGLEGARLLAAHREAHVEYNLRAHLPKDRNGGWVGVP